MFLVDTFLSLLRQSTPKWLKKIIYVRVLKAQFSRVKRSPVLSTTDYWGRHTVAACENYVSREGSLKSFHERNSQYIGYADLMPVSAFANLSILDFGCGPGHDLVGFVEFSGAKRIVGVDISPKAIELARKRLAFHGSDRVALRLLHSESDLPVAYESNSFDYVHSSGVLHHIDDPSVALRMIRRIIKPNGYLKTMVYHENSIWFHLYAGYVLPNVWKVVSPNFDTREIFRMSTDGPACPVSTAYSESSFEAIARSASFSTSMVGVAISRLEVDICDRYLQMALSDSRLKDEHRNFLSSLVLRDGVPERNGLVAGIDMVLEHRPI